MGAAERGPLDHALSRILPGPDETRLLRAILLGGAAAREAWDAFRGRERDLPALFRTDTGNRKRLAPLLLRAVLESGLEVAPALGTVLKTAALREELRVDVYRELAGQVYRTLHEAGLPFVVIRGASLAECVYPDAALRHAHDIDLLLPPAAVDAAAERLAAEGWTDRGGLPRGQGRVLRHRTELPVLLLTRGFRISFYRADFASVAGRGAPAGPDGRDPPPRPDPVDALLLVLGHASYCPGRSDLLWAVDAWMVLHRAGPIDWGAVVPRAREMRLELPLSVLLRWLREELDAPVPVAVVDELRRTGSEDGLRRDVALFGARQGTRSHPDLERSPPLPWRHRLTLLRWELLPSVAYLRWAYHDPPTLLLPALYLTRPLSALAARLKWRLLGALRNRAAPS